MDAPPVQYVKTSDGYDIAYAVCGEGPPLVMMPTQFSHAELFWQARSFFSLWLNGLAARFRLILYDGRGQGMSQRGLRDYLAIRHLVLDLEAVVDHLRLQGFSIMASQWSVHPAALFAMANPRRVAALVLSSSHLVGQDFTLAQMRPLAESRWDTFLLTQLQVGRSVDPAESLAILKQTITWADWDRLVQAFTESDLTDVAPSIETPVLVIHPRDPRLSIGDSATLAAAFPNARLVQVDGTPPFGDAEPGIDAIVRFLAEVSPNSSPALSGQVISQREAYVLRLLAAGKSNAQIAEALVISPSTVAKHVSSILAKTESANRTEAAAYAHRHGFV